MLDEAGAQRLGVSRRLPRPRRLGWLRAAASERSPTWPSSAIATSTGRTASSPESNALGARPAAHGVARAAAAEPRRRAPDAGAGHQPDRPRLRARVARDGARAGQVWAFGHSHHARTWRKAGADAPPSSRLARGHARAATFATSSTWARRACRFRAKAVRAWRWSTSRAGEIRQIPLDVSAE